MIKHLNEALKVIINDRNELHGLTQKELAHIMGAKPSMVSAHLKGELRLNKDWIERFCSALGITFGDLEEPTPRTPEPRVLREYSEKLMRLYEISPVPAFRSISRAIDDWQEAMEPVHPGKPKSAAIEDFFRVGACQGGFLDQLREFRCPAACGNIPGSALRCDSGRQFAIDESGKPDVDGHRPLKGQVFDVNDFFSASNVLAQTNSRKPPLDIVESSSLLIMYFPKGEKPLSGSTWAVFSCC